MWPESKGGDDTDEEQDERGDVEETGANREGADAQ